MLQVGRNKRYFIIDQQIAFCAIQQMSFKPPIPSVQLIQFTLFLIQGSQPITLEGRDFKS